MTTPQLYPGQTVVPHRQLSPEALRGVVEEFVTRDGTDYGDRWVPLEDRVQQVLDLLRQGAATLLFERETGRTHLVAAQR
ncbi:MAG: YheU family protein [Deferrisomatales bacterium]|nr:YheU family protein [Deferrisomatales bacterium]